MNHRNHCWKSFKSKRNPKLNNQALFPFIKGKWAIVTGASSGIGESIASILAKNQTNLILVSRNREKLLSLKSTFESLYKVKVEVLDIDLSNSKSAEEIYTFCEDHQIFVEILVNNAGYAIRTQEEALYPEKVSAMLQVMIITLTELCNRFLPEMKQNQRGWILNVSSIVGYFPMASTLTYCASKRYIIDYTRYLHFEYKQDGIKISCLLPGPTKSSFSQNNNLPIPKNLLRFYQSADKVAYLALKALAKNKQIAITGNISRILIWGSKLIPQSLLYMIQKNIWVKTRDKFK